MDKKSSSLEEQIRITKLEVRKITTKLDGVRVAVDYNMDKLKDGVKDEMTLLRDDVVTMKDEIVTELKAMREEFTAHQGSHGSSAGNP